MKTKTLPIAKAPIPCACGCGKMFSPKRAENIYFDRSCAAKINRGAGVPRRTKYGSQRT